MIHKSKFQLERLEDRNAPGTILDAISPLAMWGTETPLLNVLNSTPSDLRATTGEYRELPVLTGDAWAETPAQIQAKQQATPTGPIGDDLTGILGSLGGGGTIMGPGAIRPGFDSNSLATCDDCTHATPSPLGFTMTVNGFSFDSMRVYSNGFVSILDDTAFFLNPALVGSTDPLANLAVAPPRTGFLAAAFWGDADLRGSGTVTYGQGDWFGLPAWGATWTNVGYYDSHSDMVNTFQIILVDFQDGVNFLLEFNYATITWQSGDFAPALAPRVGWSRLNGVDGLEAMGSGAFDTMTDTGSMPLNSYDDAFGLGFGGGVPGSHWAFLTA